MTTPIAAVKAGFRNYIRFSGRATRPEFWWWILFIAIASTVLGIIDRIIERAVGIEDLTLLGSIFGLATLLPTLSVACRRLHDIGKSGWWQLLWHAIVGLAWTIVIVIFIVSVIGFAKSGGWDLVTRADWTEFLFAVLPALLAVIVAAAVSLAVLIWAIVWLARPGEPGANRHGPDPRAAADNPPAYPGQNDRYTDDQR